MSIEFPFYDFRIDNDGQLVLSANGVSTVTDVDLVRQHARNLIMLNFKGTDYMSLPNNTTTGLILKEDLSDILERDVFLRSIGMTVVVEVYPKDLNSIGFSVTMSNGSMTVDLGIDGFLNLRAGILLGLGDFKLEPTIYSTTVKKVYERFHVSGNTSTIALTRPLVPNRQVFIFDKASISGFVDGLPVPVLTNEIGTFQMVSGMKLIPLSDFLTASGFLRVYNITLTQADNTPIPESQYSVVGTYLVFDGVTYTGQVTANANLVEVAGDVTKYTETNGIHPVDIYPSARENKEYLVTLSGNLALGDYFILYDSFEVTQ